jgi:O-antigen/teichoic acid export membrane protein
MLLIILKKNLILRSRSHILLINLKKNSKWLTLNNILIHFYDLFDKYLIKLFLGSVALAIYTIPQQLTGKLSIVSKGFSAYLLTKLSRKKNDNEIFNFSLKLFLKVIPIFIFILFPFYEFILKFWLGEQYDQKILLLTKVFSICAIFSCASHLLITKFEASKSLKKNLKIELSFIPFFLTLLYFLTSNRYSLIAISFLILFKEVILLILRLTILKKVIKNLNFFYTYILDHLVNILYIN